MGKNKRRIIFTLSVFVFALSFIYSITNGQYTLSVNDILRILSTNEQTLSADIFFKIRLPRVVFAGISGITLSICGYAYQELFSNPLASPDILGAGSGAGFGASFAIVLGLSSYFIQVSGLVFSIFAVMITYFLAVLMDKKTTSISLVLSGIVIKALSDAGIMALKYFSKNEGVLSSIEYKLMGSFRETRKETIIEVLPFVMLGLVILYIFKWKIRVLTLGDNKASTLGVPAKIVRLVCIFAATVPVASIISHTGIISWVGLIVPHTVRFFIKGDLKDNFGICAFFGGAFMMLTDTLSRTLTLAEIPISIFTSFFGAILLAFILITRRTKNA